MAAARWAGIRDAKQVKVLERLRALLDEVAPGGARTRVDRAKGWGTVELVGSGKRRLRGMKRDLREHAVRAVYDGRWLQVSYEVDGDRRETLSLPMPTEADLRRAAELFARHARRIWWKAPAGEDGSRAPKRR
jgi:hypothetical protein